jgi:hypothetical protein
MAQASAKVHYGTTHTFTTKTNQPQITLKAGTGQMISIDSSVTLSNAIQYVTKLSDFPAPVSLGINLESNKTYIITTYIDLEGNYIRGSDNTVIRGTSTGSATLISTGLTGSYPMITTNNSIEISNITLIADNLFYLSSIDTTFVCVINRCAITSALLGTIANYSNIDIRNCVFTASQGFLFDLAVDIIRIIDCSCTVGTTDIFYGFLSTLVISQFISIIGCSLTINDTAVGVFFDGVSLRDERFIIRDCSFSGTSTTRLSGITAADNVAIFNNNLGLTESMITGSIDINSGAATTLTVNVWKKLGCTTVASSLCSKFSSSADNQLNYTGPKTRTFRVYYNVAFTGTANDVVLIGVSKNGADPVAECISSCALAAVAGKQPSSGLAFLSQLKTGDYLEVWVKNTTGSNTVTSQQLSLIAT